MAMPTDEAAVQRFPVLLKDLTKEISEFPSVVKQPWQNTHLNQESHSISDYTTLLRSTLPVTLPVNACEDAIGGVLLQNDQPVWATPGKNYAQTEKSVMQLSLAWVSGTSAVMENTTSRYIQIIDRSR